MCTHIWVKAQPHVFFLIPKGLDLMVESEKSFTIGVKIQLSWGPNSKAMGTPWGSGQTCGCKRRNYIKNGFVTCAHISGSNPTPTSFFYKSKDFISTGLVNNFFPSYVGSSL